MESVMSVKANFPTTLNIVWCMECLNNCYLVEGVSIHFHSVGLVVFIDIDFVHIYSERERHQIENHV